MIEHTQATADSRNALDTPNGLAKSDCPEWPAPPGQTLVLVLAAFLLSVGGTVWLASSTSRSLTGVLQAHRTRVFADRAAQIKTIEASEGAAVKPGDTIIVLTDRSLESRLREQRRRVAELVAQLQQARSRADVEIVWRLKDVERELVETKLRSAGYLKSQLDDQVEQQAWADVAAGNFPSFPRSSVGTTLRSHAERGNEKMMLPEFLFQPAGTSRTFGWNDEARVQALLKQHAAENAAEVSSVQIRLCEGRLRELETLRAELPAKIRQAAGIDETESRLSSAREELKQLQAQPQVVPLKAATYGTVGVYRKHVGDTVRQDERIVELLDEERQFVVVQIPTEHLAGLAERTQVELRFPGGEERTGVIGTIPPQTASTVTGNGVTKQTPTVSVRIEPAGKLWPKIPLGTPVEVVTKR